ncbi:MAG TPA: hypothetical protein VGA20_06485, partial [Gemmatimonadales bacterium]
NGIRHSPGAVLLMRHTITFLLLLTTGASPGTAQAVPRADTPPKGSVRITVDPIVELWDAQFVAGRRVRLAAPLAGDTVGDAYIPVVARLEQDIRTAGGFLGYHTSLGRTTFGLRHERRTTALTAELGITDRLSIAVRAPLVRAFTRVHLAIDTTGSNLGLNPLLVDPANAGSYETFFSQFDQALNQLEQNIAAGSYGCPSSPQCMQATTLLGEARGVRDALSRSVYGTGTAGAAPFLPRAGSSGGTRVSSNLLRIQQDLASSYSVTGFTSAFLLPTDAVDQAGMTATLTDATYGFGVHPFASTPLRLRFWPGDVEAGVRYRLAMTPAYAATLAALVRLPTGHTDSPHDATDLATGDGQTDFEAQVVQELVLLQRLWLNLSVRAGVQRSSERVRRVAPPEAFLVPRSAATRLRWDPGDYVAVDFAPLYRFGGRLAAGITMGLLAQTKDRSTFLAPQDSVDLATRLGAPTPASLLDRGTDVRRVRIGVAATYVGPGIEGGLSVERTVSASSGTLAAATVLRILLRVSRPLF